MSDEKKNSSEKGSDLTVTKDATMSAANAASGTVDSTANDKADAQSPIKETTENTASKPAHKKTVRHHKKRHIPWAAVFALILIIGLGAGNYWQYQTGQNLSQLVSQLSAQQSALDSQVADLNNGVTEIQEQQKSLVEKTEQNEAGRRTVLGTLDEMSEQIKSLATSKGKEPLFWRVSEVEYLLTIANHRLMLEGDVLTARTALQDADNRLRAIADPGLIPVREKISQEINQLNSVSLPDIPGLAAQLSGMIDNVNQLPFVKKELSLESESAPEAEKEFTGVGNFLKTVWRDLVDGLFKVQRTDQAIEPLLPPEEKIYLVYNLELKLEQARIALLNRETTLFRTNLEDVRQSVATYFDRESASVTSLLQTVTELKQVELRPQLPDISASLRELRSWLQNQRQKNVASHVVIQEPDYLAHYATEGKML
ncbi:uroporphyrinogen-III C-methyltransferase [Kaarinaea lacus]